MKSLEYRDRQLKVMESARMALGPALFLTEHTGEESLSHRAHRGGV